LSRLIPPPILLGLGIDDLRNAPKRKWTRRLSGGGAC
jgi:hypothetical protein